MSLTHLRINAALLLLALCACSKGAPDAIQPVDFNHKIHIAGKVDCLQCHEGVLTPEVEPMPTLETCTSCHKEDTDKAKKMLEAKAKELTPKAQFTPLLRLADHVFFSHLWHSDVANLDCKDCHAEVYESTTAPLYSHTVTMDACIDCHKKHMDKKPNAKRAVFDCAACHR